MIKIWIFGLEKFFFLFRRNNLDQRNENQVSIPSRCRDLDKTKYHDIERNQTHGFDHFLDLVAIRPLSRAEDWHFRIEKFFFLFRSNIPGQRMRNGIHWMLSLGYLAHKKCYNSERHLAPFSLQQLSESISDQRTPYNFHLSFSYFIGNSGRSSMLHSTANASEARRVVWKPLHDHWPILKSGR